MTFYRLLLFLYPAAFRAEYGTELACLFAQRLRDASNPFARCLLWLETFTDIVISAFETHWDILRQDVRYTFRTLRRSPGFTATAIIVTALGVGATTATYTIADYVLLRPLPFPESDRLVMLWEDMSPGSYKRMEPSPANYRDWKQMSRSFSAMAAIRPLSVGLVGVGEPEQIEGASVTADLFPMLGAQPFIGRLLTPDDDRPGAPGVVVLSYGLWKQRFGADPAVIGKRLLLAGYPYVVIGVMNKDFAYPNRTAQLWTAMRFENSDFKDRNDNYLGVLAKLRPGVSIDQARSEMHLVSERLRRMYPKDNEHVDINILQLGKDQVSDRARLTLYALLAASFCVLLIACTNLASLLLARALVRRKEVSVRNALGAGRERLVRQMLTESLMLALLGGLAGVLLAASAVPLLAKLVPNSLPVAAPPSIDSRIWIFALVLTTFTGICFGVIPAVRASSGLTASGLQEGSRQGVGGRRERLRSALVITEITVSLVLLVSCGLLIRALWRIQQINPGFRAENVLTLRTSLLVKQYEFTARRVQFYTRVLSGVRQLPGVISAGYTSFLPIVAQGGIWPVNIAGQPPNVDRAFHQASLRFITPGFLETMGIPLLRGRVIQETDTDKSQYVAVVSESFVREYWPHEDPIGHQFDIGFATRTIVGVVGDVRVRGLERTSEPQVYLSYKQVPDGAITWYAPKDLAIRSTIETAKLLPLVRRIIAEADPQQPISDVQTLTHIVEEETSSRLMQVRVLGGFALIAILLAGTGIHGLLSFTVSNRSQEIGVRIAVGARSKDILAMVFHESALLTAAGTAAGIALAYGAGRTLESLLAGIEPADLATYAAGIALVACMSLVGSFRPALQALRVDPIAAIRVE